MFPPAAFLRCLPLPSSNPATALPRDRHLALYRAAAPSLSPRHSLRFLVRSPRAFSSLSPPLILRLSVSRALSARVYKPCVAIYIKRRSVSLCRFAGTRASASGFGGGGRGGRGKVRRGFSLSRAALALRRGENRPKILERDRRCCFGRPVAAGTSANSREKI